MIFQNNKKVDGKDEDFFANLDSIEYFYRIVDQCLDRDSLEYECFARYFGIDGRDRFKMREIAEELEIP